MSRTSAYARPWDWQILINGFIAERAYDLGEIVEKFERIQGTTGWQGIPNLEQ
jgi:hypothetical protein